MNKKLNTLETNELSYNNSKYYKETNIENLQINIHSQNWLNSNQNYLKRNPSPNK
jgi:hypothetical protein